MSHPKWFKRLGAHARHPFWTGVLTFYVLVVGGYWSLYSSEIRQAFPFYLGPYGGVSWIAVGAWGSAALAWIVFWAREITVIEEQDGVRSEFRAAKDDLVALIRTMPPRDFMRRCASITAKTDTLTHLLMRALKGGNTAVARRAVPFLLRQVARLARSYDSDPNATYGANIMRFVPSADLVPPAGAEVEKRLRFVEEGTTIGGLGGVLDLRPELSSTDKVDPDPSLIPVALPIPIDRTCKHILPGAPRAFCEGALSVFSDVSVLASWMKEHGDFTDRVRNEVQRYFGENTAFRSFASLPLAVTDIKRTDLIGVVNIHSGGTGILRGGEGAEMFHHALQPILGMLARVLRELWKREASAPAAGPAKVTGP